MNNLFKAIKITDNVYWVGVIDWKIRNFHGYATNRGTTYNAYLILDEKITLIDTVKQPFKDEFLGRISSIIDPGDIDYIISNHSEMDHSGLLPDIIDIAKPEKVFASQMGLKALQNHFYNIKDVITPLKDKENLAIGRMDLTFFETRMLHWPDSMFTFLSKEKILFTNDVFGMHLATFERFDSEIDFKILEYEAGKYYANIILPFSSFVEKAMKKMEELNLDVNYIATDHGPIWQAYINKIMDFYKLWPLQKRKEKAIIVYDTMWESTAKMATAMSEGLSDSDIATVVLPLSVSHRSDIATELLDAGAFIIGTPVLNNNIYPTVADILTYIKGLRPKGLIGCVFGSYGWSKPPLDNLKGYIEKEMGIEYVGDVVKSNYVPDKETLQACYEQGKLVANRLKEKCNETLEMHSVRIHS